MPRGGARPGAGRPRKPKASAVEAPIAATSELAAAIAQAKDLTLRLLDELKAVTAHIGELEDLIVDETAADEDGGRRRNALLKAVSLGARSATLKTLLAATRGWAELERPAKQSKPGAQPSAPQADAPAAPQNDWDFLDEEAPRPKSMN